MHSRPAENEYEFIQAAPRFAGTINDCSTYDGLIKTDNFDDRSYREEFERRCRASERVGAYHFRDIELTGAWMLISTEQCRTAYNLLPGIGWTQQHIDLFLTRQKIDHLRGPSRFVLSGEIRSVGIPARHNRSSTLNSARVRATERQSRDIVVSIDAGSDCSGRICFKFSRARASSSAYLREAFFAIMAPKAEQASIGKSLSAS
jgi:hypothetical protein